MHGIFVAEGNLAFLLNGVKTLEKCPKVAGTRNLLTLCYDQLVYDEQVYLRWCIQFV